MTRRGIGRIALPLGLALAATVGFAAARGGPQAAQAKPPGGPFGFSQVVYLSHVNTLDMPLFPGDPQVRLRTLFTVEKDGFRLNYMEIGEHTGTHWGSPCHFNLGEVCAEGMRPEDFFHPAVVIDGRAKTAANVDFELSVQDLRDFEARYSRIPDNAMVILWTGFQDRWGNPASYINADKAGVLHFPGFSVQATQWLIDNRSLGGLGIDTLGVDPGPDEEFKTNTLLLHGHRIHLENLAGLEQMPPTGGWVVVGGVRNEGGSGSPATVFGLVP